MAVVLGLILLGAAAVLLAAAQTWLSAAWERPGFPAVRVDLSGGEAVPIVRAAGFVALAGVVAVLATRRRGRLVVGALVAAVGVAAVIGCLLFAVSDQSSADAELAQAAGETTATVHATELSVSGWAPIAGAGGAVVAAGGVLTVLRGARWPVMGGRYDAPAGSARRHDDPWAALDQGEDPTTRG